MIHQGRLWYTKGDYMIHQGRLLYTKGDYYTPRKIMIHQGRLYDTSREIMTHQETLYDTPRENDTPRKIMIHQGRLWYNKGDYDTPREIMIQTREIMIQYLPNTSIPSVPIANISPSTYYDTKFDVLWILNTRLSAFILEKQLITNICIFMQVLIKPTQQKSNLSLQLIYNI